MALRSSVCVTTVLQFERLLWWSVYSSDCIYFHARRLETLCLDCSGLVKAGPHPLAAGKGSYLKEPLSRNRRGSQRYSAFR